MKLLCRSTEEDNVCFNLRCQLIRLDPGGRRASSELGQGTQPRLFQRMAHKSAYKTREQRGINISGSWGSQWESARLFKVGRSRKCTRAQLICNSLYCMVDIDFHHSQSVLMRSQQGRNAATFVRFRTLPPFYVAVQKKMQSVLKLCGIF